MVKMVFPYIIVFLILCFDTYIAQYLKSALYDVPLNIFIITILINFFIS